MSLIRRNLSDYFVALSVIACSLVLLGALTFALSGYRFKKPTRTLQINYEDVTGIKVNSEVRYAGAPAGRVIAMRHLTAKERDASANKARCRFHRTDHMAKQSTLSTAAAAHDNERFAPLNIKRNVIEPWDLYSGMIKSVVFAWLVITIACNAGLNVQGGAEGVGQATTASVVQALLAMLVMNAVLTGVFFFLVDDQNDEARMSNDEIMTRSKNQNARAEEPFWDKDVAVVREEPEANRLYDLDERTARFGEAVIDFAKAIPKDTVTNRIISQLVGAATSVGANYVEADDAVSKKDFLKSIGTCKKEVREVKHFLRMAVRAVPKLKPEARSLWLEARELHLIFSKIWRSGKKRAVKTL